MKKTDVVAAIIGLSLTLPGVSFAAHDTVVTQWDNEALEAIRVTHPGPPVVARALSIVHTCMFDAWAAYDGKAKGTQFGKNLRRPVSERTVANKQEAVSYAAYRALLDLFPTQKAAFDNRLAQLGYDPLNMSTDTHTPSGLGNVACHAVLEFRHHDGSNQLGDLHPGAYSDYTGYAPVNTPASIVDPNHWQPLSVSNGHGGFVSQTYIAPHWGKVVPFALNTAHQFRPGPPKPFASKGYMDQAREVLMYSATLTDTQKAIAEYWADGPSSELPPGHWALFAQFVSQRDQYNIDNNVRLFFALTNAVFDASIASWEAKRFYDYVRPVTAINYLFNNQLVTAWAGPNLGTGSILGQNWRPYQAVTVVTPPFPEYISGHSTFSMAGATILQQYTGSDVFGNSVTLPAGSSRVETNTPAHDITLSWATFTDAAEEAGISRRYGGIHFKDGDLAGRDVGRKVGLQAWKKSLEYFGIEKHDNKED
ncbi:MAG: vanadium-dependent haloperoxidase [Candidatus Methylumidiphilus sp.]